MKPRRVPKLTEVQRAERWVAENYRRRLEADRAVFDMEGCSDPGVAVSEQMHKPTLVRLPSDPGDWSPEHHKLLLDTTDGQKFYRRRAGYIRDDLRAVLRNARRTFSLRLDTLED